MDDKEKDDIWVRYRPKWDTICLEQISHFHTLGNKENVLILLELTICYWGFQNRFLFDKI